MSNHWSRECQASASLGSCFDNQIPNSSHPSALWKLPGKNPANSAADFRRRPFHDKLPSAVRRLPLQWTYSDAHPHLPIHQGVWVLKRVLVCLIVWNNSWNSPMNNSWSTLCAPNAIRYDSHCRIMKPQTVKCYAYFHFSFQIEDLKEQTTKRTL